MLSLLGALGWGEAERKGWPRQVYTLKDSYPDTYAVTSPCNLVPGCTSPAVQSPDLPSSCGLPLGLPSMTTASALPSGGDGVRLTLGGGSNRPGCPSGRTLVYDMVCDKGGTSGGPNATITVVNGCTYVVTWLTAAACSQAATPPAQCHAPNIPTPTAPQLRYQRGEIVALTHFNMASFVKNGDPGCTADNWLVKAIGAAGPSGDPATFNPTQLDTDQWADV